MYLYIHQAGSTLYMLALPYIAHITVDLNLADWAASVAQLAEHWTSNPVVTGSNPVRGSSVFYFTVCLQTLPYLVLICIYMYETDMYTHMHMVVDVLEYTYTYTCIRQRHQPYYNDRMHVHVRDCSTGA